MTLKKISILIAFSILLMGIRLEAINQYVSAFGGICWSKDRFDDLDVDFDPWAFKGKRETAADDIASKVK